MASSPNIVDVNIDCLERVFNHLDLIDLINMADKNKHLGQATSRIFDRKYKGKTVLLQSREFYSIWAQDPIVITNDAIVIRKPKLAFQMLRLFGCLISKLFMDALHPTKVDKELLNYVNEYCSESLKSFTLKNRDLTYTDAKKPYTNVEEFSMVSRIIGFQASEFKDTFPYLRRLELIRTRFSNHTRFAIQFHHLEHLKISIGVNKGYEITKSDAKKIIQLNPQLQSLSVSGEFYLKFWAYASKQLKQLKILELGYDRNKIQKFPTEPIRFECIETLKLNMIYSHTKWNPEKIFSFNQLKEFTIIGYDLDDSWINFTIENPTIEKLNIIKQYTHQIRILFLTDEDMVKLATMLPNLNEFYMTGCSCSVDAAGHFLNESQSLRKFSMTVPDKDDLDELYSNITTEWNATKSTKFIVIEKM